MMEKDAPTWEHHALYSTAAIREIKFISVKKEVTDKKNISTKTS